MTELDGIPGLSSIPILKYLFGSKDHQITDDEIVFLLVPHVVRSPDLTRSNLQADRHWSRAADRIAPHSTEGRHLSPIAPPARPRLQPGIGSVPGQSAQAAAPEALAQMRASAQGRPSAGNAECCVAFCDHAPPGQATAPAGPGCAARSALLTGAVGRTLCRHGHHVPGSRCGDRGAETLRPCRCRCNTTRRSSHW